MTRRTSTETLEALVTYINKLTNSPEKPYTQTNTGLTANINNYHLTFAYGGVGLQRMANSGGGVHTIFGYGKKSELEAELRAFIRGLEQAKEVA